MLPAGVACCCVNDTCYWTGLVFLFTMHSRKPPRACAATALGRGLGWLWSS